MGWRGRWAGQTLSGVRLCWLVQHLCTFEGAGGGAASGLNAPGRANREGQAGGPLGRLGGFLRQAWSPWAAGC